MMTGKDHDIRNADKRGLAALLDFAENNDSEEKAKEEKSHEEDHEGREVVEGKNRSTRAKIGNNGSSSNA